MAMIAAASDTRRPNPPSGQVDLLRHVQTLETRALAHHLIRG
jgi:hypothetical protein